jgi:predicted glycoside hydrolase/deacetylase ChbG (UPF0249 family)
VAIGLHVTLTAPFRPLNADFKPLQNGAFLPLGSTLMCALLRRLDPDALTHEVESQIRAFIDLFGRPPDFIDGHQHVQLFPQIRDAVLQSARKLAPTAWLRQCGRIGPWYRRWYDRKAILLDLLSIGFRRRATTTGARTNPGFAGTYSFNAHADFANTFPRFLERLPDGSVVMCHPGFVDAELRRLDPLTDLREREFEFLASDRFTAILAAQRISLVTS